MPILCSTASGGSGFGCVILLRGPLRRGFSREAKRKHMPVLAQFFKRCSLCIQIGSHCTSHLFKADRPFDLLVFPFKSIFSHDPKRITFQFQGPWATETWMLQELERFQISHTTTSPSHAPSFKGLLVDGTNWEYWARVPQTLEIN